MDVNIINIYNLETVIAVTTIRHSVHTAFTPRHETSIHPVTSLAQRKHKEQVFKMLNYSRS